MTSTWPCWRRDSKEQAGRTVNDMTSPHPPYAVTPQTRQLEIDYAGNE